MQKFQQRLSGARLAFCAVACAAVINPAVSAVSAVSAAAAAAAGDDALPSELRVCAAADELPYSGKDQPGFENTIATIIGEGMNRPVTFTWSDKPAIYLVRDYLDKGKCDLIMGVDTRDPRVATSQPYYRSGYAFVYRKDRNLDITNWHSPDLKKLDRFAMVFGTPAEVMLKKIGRFETTFNYMHSLSNFKSRRNEYIRVDPARIIGEVASGKADIAVVFAPEAARYIKEYDDKLKVVMIPDSNVRSDGMPVPFQYNQSMAVRKGDKALLKEVNEAIDKRRGDITAVLKGEGIPLLPIGDGGNTRSAQQ